MNDLAIKVEGLSKQYRIGGPQEEYRTFRDTFMNAITSPFRKARDLMRGVHTGAAGLTETIWALKDISFEVKKGEVVGIIGRNGAGKTTLLKILSQVTEPTEGYADIYGRVGSLLEVGTGFHPELTGRENIYLNGSILGMKKREIDQKFEEIVAFAEIKKFIDTPVKHYSSGMYVRLAFAVAAYFEPEMLFVDEVLAVGDMEFQKKCLGKMDDVAKTGRTVLFVSHNIGLMAELCQKGLLLSNGMLVMNGRMQHVIHHYLATKDKQSDYQIEHIPVHINKKAYIANLKTIGNDKQRKRTFSFNDNINLHISFRLQRFFATTTLGVAVLERWGKKIFTTIHPFTNLTNGEYQAVMSIPPKTLLPGNYSFDVAIFIPNGEAFDYVKDGCNFDIVDTGSDFSIFGNADIGLVNVKCKWEKL